MLVAPERACPEEVAVGALDEEALGDAVEPVPDEDVAELDGEAEEDDVLSEPEDAEELDEADEPSLDWLRVCSVSVTVVVVVTVAGDESEPALRTGAPAKTPTTMETQKTAMMAAAIPIGLRYFLIRTIRAPIGEVGEVEVSPASASSGSSESAVITRVSPVGVFGCHRSTVLVPPLARAP